MATESSFDYSSFVIVGATAAISEGWNSHPQLGKGLDGYGRYYWRGFLDRADGNYLVMFVLPSVFHQDERYFAMRQGSFLKRAGYSASRVLITPDYHGNRSFNVSEVLGRGMAQAIALSYYPSRDRTAGKFASSYALAVAGDAVMNALCEFWPDIAGHLHRHPAPEQAKR